VTAHVALGTNRGNRWENLRAGLRGLAQAGLGVEALSAVWETEPVDCPAPGRFLNMAAAVRASCSPRELLDILLAIESRHGRVRSTPNAPRTLDLDLLLVGDLRWHDERLELPHPRMWRRRFVLEPLAEIAPGARNPRSGLTVAQHLARCPRHGAVVRVGRLPPCGIIRPAWPATLRRSAPTDEIQIDRG
jgi:2-amino-4-hydroxy-6-hydroxymethyldihydropteridine diphosphokinase